MLGLATIKKCLEHNVEIIAIARKHSARSFKIPVGESVTLIEADLEDLATLDTGITDCDAFFHFGWGYTARESRDNLDLQMANVAYCLDAVRLANRMGCSVFVGAGSQAEYGIVTEELFPDTEPNPVVAYGKAKLEAGRRSLELCKKLGMTCIWTRIFSVYGTNDVEGTMIKSAIIAFNAGETMHFSSGVQNWNFLFEEDAGELFYSLAKTSPESGVYHVAGVESKPLKEFIFELAAVLGEDFKYELAPVDPDAAPAVSLIANMDKTIAACGYTPSTAFTEGIKKVLG